MTLRDSLRRFYGLPPLDTKANRAWTADVMSSPALMSSTVSPHFRDFKGYLEAYKIPWVFRCVRAISENAANVKYALFESEEKDAPEITSSPLLDLLKRPNPNQSRMQFLESLFTDLELVGNAFVSLEERDGAGRPSELYRLRPDRVAVIADVQSLIKGYVYNANGKRIDYAADEMWRTIYPNPLDDLYGMGTIEAAEARMDSELAMEEHERQFWRNGAKITGVFSTADTLDDTLYARVANSIRAFFRGSGYSSLLLENGLSYAPISESPAKLGLLELSLMSRDAILSIFGVPPTKLGILDNANYKAQAADSYWWTELIDPKLTRMEDSIAALVERFHPGKGYHFRFERLNFEDDMPAATVAVQMANQHVFTIDEIRAYQGKEPLPNGQGNIILGPISEIPLDLANDLPTINEARAATGDPPLVNGDELILVRGRAVAINLASPLPPPPPQGVPVGFDSAYASLPSPPTGKVTKVEAKALRVGGMAPASAVVTARHRDRLIANAKSDLAPHVAAAMTRQEARVRAKLLEFKHRKAALSTDGIFDDDEENDRLADDLDAVYLAGFGAGSAVVRGVTSFDPAPFADVRTTLRPRAALINRTTRDALTEVLDEGKRRGYSTTQIADGVAAEQYGGVTSVYQAATGYRAETIARTEAMQAFNGLLTASYKSGGVRYCEIVDGMSDPLCAAENGQIYPIDEVPMVLGREHPNGQRSITPLLEG